MAITEGALSWPPQPVRRRRVVRRTSAFRGDTKRGEISFGTMERKAGLE
jgi:hypothetical protein